MTNCGHILAVDVGLSFCKALLFDEAGDVIASASSPTPVSNPSSGLSEINMTDLWQVVSGIMRQAAGRNSVAAIGISGHGNGIYWLDANNAQVSNAVTSMDRRAEAEIAHLSNEQKNLLTTRSTQSLWAGQPGMILRWLKHKHPNEYSRIDKIMLCKDYLSFMLTGVYATDWSDISASGLLNNISGKYDADMLEAMGIAEVAATLPPIIKSFDIRSGVSGAASDLTGIKVGTPVIGGMFDVDACVYGAGVIEPGTLCAIAGTWNINAAVVETSYHSTKIRQCIRRSDGQNSMLIDSSATSAVNLEWALKKMLHLDYKSLDTELAVHEWNVDSPYWLPFINGSLNTAVEKGALLGLDISHDSKDVMAAIAEGICFAHRFHIENLVEAGAEFAKIRLTGGAAKNSFCQLFANICGYLVEAVNEKQTGAAGIRAAANVARGKCTAMQSSACVMKEFTPCRNQVALFNVRYKQFKEFIKCPL